MKDVKARHRARKGKPIRQVGALPYRRSPSGELEFLLLTSRGTGRFVIPKGWRMKGRSDGGAAAKEAEQEAGVVGTLHPVPVGIYRYWKRLVTIFVPVTVTVYALEVTGELANWKERRERKRKWLSREEALSLVDEPEFVSLLANFEAPDPVVADEQ